MMANNRIPSGPNTPGSQQTPTQQGIKIFIQRDYSEGTAVKFQTRFPPELEDRIDRQTFEYTMERLNEHFEMAETADCSTYCEGLMDTVILWKVLFPILFIYISDINLPFLFLSQHLRKVSKFIATQNERVYNPRGIHITDPILRGLRVIEITVIDVPNCQSPTGNSNNQMRHT
ncbi:hypothetical protein HW555_008405 [Spodoptera exigua]|uniref:Ras modification protein ERF4 n=1 Tax=Spodoptera exigua TaxID=7107 RepID=A0A835GD30_SPOEX|nr:hypothetical protein HW555_008405 [Spodoptera exigua]